MADPFATGLDEDPAADFLAREQQELAGLEDDGFGGLASDPPAENLSQENPAVAGDGLDFFADDLVPSTVPAPAQDSLDVTDFGSASLAAFDAPVSSDALAGADASLDPLVDPVVPPTSESEGFVLDSFTTSVAEEVNGDAEPSESSVAPTQKTLLWREEQLKKIAEKDKNEEAKLEEWRNTAKRELEEWYARQAEQVEKHKKNNRVAEAEFVKERDETTPGNEWERISRLCDFNPKNNKNTKDVSKLRSLLLQLKQNPLSRASTA